LIVKTLLFLLLGASVVFAWLPYEVMTTVQDQIPALVIGGFSIPLIVFLIIEAAKYVGLLRTSDAVRVTNLTLSLLFGGVWLLVRLRPEYEPMIVLIMTALVGSLGSALIYTIIQNVKHNGKEIPGGVKQPIYEHPPADG
jgi:hypothetical protein